MKRTVPLAAVLLISMAQGASGALLSLEWAHQPGVTEYTMDVGETATIDIRLDLVSGESFGWAETPLAIGTLYDPDPTPQFQITGFYADGAIGPGFTYDRSVLPPFLSHLMSTGSRQSGMRSRPSSVRPPFTWIRWRSSR